MDRSASRAFRARCRSGEWDQPTAGQALGFAQANLVVLPREDAFDFLLFCQRNPKPCPLLDVTEAGDFEPKSVAKGADLRTDLPKYCCYRQGELEGEYTDLTSFWRGDFVSFLLGCSFTFESTLLRAGLGVRHLEPGADGRTRNVPMYRTNIPCRPAGRFAGPLVVSMRPYTPAAAIEAAVLTARFPQVHGAPIFFGDYSAIGISDLSRPDWGDAVKIHPGETPVFWACGVTPQAVILAAKTPLAFTHAPGHMFITDLLDEELASPRHE